MKSIFKKKLKSMGYKSYPAYLASKHWMEFRMLVVNRDRACLVCGGKPMQVHHLTYERIGCELPTDAVALCKPCHRLVHNVHRLRRIPLIRFDLCVEEIRRGARPSRRPSRRPNEGPSESRSRPAIGHWYARRRMAEKADKP